MDLITIRLETDGTITSQLLDSLYGNNIAIQSTGSLPVNSWTLLTVSFLTDTTQIFSYFTIYFGNVLQAWALATPDPIYFDSSDDVLMGGNLALDEPLWIAKISIYSPGSNYVASLSKILFFLNSFHRFLFKSLFIM